MQQFVFIYILTWEGQKAGSQMKALPSPLIHCLLHQVDGISTHSKCQQLLIMCHQLPEHIISQSQGSLLEIPLCQNRSTENIFLLASLIVCFLSSLYAHSYLSYGEPGDSLLRNLSKALILKEEGVLCIQFTGICKAASDILNLFSLYTKHSFNKGYNHLHSKEMAFVRSR